MIFTHIQDVELPKLVSETNSSTGERYYTLLDGRKVPSITTVLSHFKSIKLQGWRDNVGEGVANRKMRMAAMKGTYFHDMVEKYLNNQEPTNIYSNMPDSMAMFKKAKVEIDKNIDRVLYTEQSLSSYEYGIAGTCDLVADWDGLPSIIDFKTSDRIKTEEEIQNYFEQLVGYQLMLLENTGIYTTQIVSFITNVDHHFPVQIFVKHIHDNKEDMRKYEQSLIKKIKQYKERIL